MSDDGEDRTPRAVGVGRQLLRRAPLLVILALLAWLYWGKRPREVLLAYDLPDHPAPTRAEVSIRAEDGSTPAAIAWGTGEGPARDLQEQKARLAPGSYRLVATLTFSDGTRQDIDRPLEITADDERIVVHLTSR
jgi:hypothetical protein